MEVACHVAKMCLLKTFGRIFTKIFLRRCSRLKTPFSFLVAFPLTFNFFALKFGKINATLAGFTFSGMTLLYFILNSVLLKQISKS